VQSKPLGPSNCCRTSFINALRTTRQGRHIDPLSPLDLDFEEEHLETSNALTISHVEDSSQIITPTTMVTITKETQTGSVPEREITTTPQMLLEA